MKDLEKRTSLNGRCTGVVKDGTSVGSGKVVVLNIGEVLELTSTE